MESVAWVHNIKVIKFNNRWIKTPEWQRLIMR